MLPESGRGVSSQSLGGTDRSKSLGAGDRYWSVGASFPFGMVGVVLRVVKCTIFLPF